MYGGSDNVLPTVRHQQGPWGNHRGPISIMRKCILMTSLIRGFIVPSTSLPAIIYCIYSSHICVSVKSYQTFLCVHFLHTCFGCDQMCVDQLSFSVYCTEMYCTVVLKRICILSKSSVYSSIFTEECWFYYLAIIAQISLNCITQYPMSPHTKYSTICHHVLFIDEIFSWS